MSELDDAMREFWRALAAANGHVGRAADALAVGRRTLQKKMREYGMPAGTAGRKSRFA